MKLQVLIPIVITAIVLTILTLVAETHLHPGKAIMLGFIAIILGGISAGICQDYDWDARAERKHQVDLAKARVVKG